LSDDYLDNLPNLSTYCDTKFFRNSSSFSSKIISRKLLKPIKKNFSPLEWNNFFDKKLFIEIGENNTFCAYVKGEKGPILYFLHGGGYSALTWACLTEELSELIECRIFAVDLRCHGDSTTSDDYDLSVERQVDDIVMIYSKYFGDEVDVPTFLIGHSMGGALAVHVALSARIKSVVGLCVIDVVEGTAMEALKTMTTFLQSRPKNFTSLESAIEWAYRSGTAKNLQAARVSMPSQVKKVDEHYIWRINLLKTQPHWTGWFKGLSKRFLSCNVPKLLILAGTDRLDTDLTVGQMQGKFQNTILPKTGHAIQEDAPDKLAHLDFDANHHSA
uniref:Protein phosphatase methylesterase 1 n=1 Tax=Dracunculus medinensis TaxID=318479 RepID=A0A0N4U1V6_DRAME